MSPLFWTIALLVVGLLVMVLEVFLPSGGILGFISVVAILAAVVMAFVEEGPAVGIVVLAAAVVAVPSVLIMAFRWFPKTPLGRRVLPPPPDASEVLPDSPLRRRARSMVGRTGRVVREMLPWGSVEIDGTTFEAVSETGLIELGATVEAVGVQGMSLVVRPATPEAAAPAVFSPPDLESTRGASPAEAPGQKAVSGLSDTLEEFDFERFRPPAG
jgi:membrane-bound ClpP family serine protease